MITNPDKVKHRMTKEEACALFVQHYDYVRLVAFREAPTRSLHDDIAQDVFIEFTENASKWTWDGTEATLKGLLRTITKTIALQYWRKWAREQPDYLEKIAYLILPKETEEESRHSNLPKQIAALQNCLEKLSPENRELIELYYYKGIGSKELILRVKRKAGTVYSLLSRLRAVLLDCVQRTLDLEVLDV
ncbi:MAG: sigma-70 family RNA polymerase sigma factor [Planctomycetia bacterium]|nr:sigma-70 family RNA polymerase sigma factor [Planctomycetia bacterium]